LERGRRATAECSFRGIKQEGIQYVTLEELLEKQGENTDTGKWREVRWDYQTPKRRKCAKGPSTVCRRKRLGCHTRLATKIKYVREKRQESSGIPSARTSRGGRTRIKEEDT